MHRCTSLLAMSVAAGFVGAGCASTAGVSSVGADRLPVPTPAPVSVAAPTTTAPAATPTTAPARDAVSTVADPTTTTSPVVRRVSMAFTGDILAHSPLWRQAGRNAHAAGTDGYDFGPMLAGLAPVLESVDLAVCHLETPIAPADEELSTSPFYGVPAEVVDAIADAGYDHCSTASNHTADRGVTGVDRTVEVLLAAGVSQSGMARTPVEIEPRLIDVGGVTVCLLSYTFSYNGLRFPDDQQWRSALIDPERIAADVEAARSGGAELVVVSLHWGDEKVHRPSRHQLDVAETLTALGTIDLIVGHHAHVLQPIELVNGTWVVYGLGNVLSNMPTSDDWPAASQDAAVVTVEFELAPGGAVSVRRPVVHPTWVDKWAGWQAVLVVDELGRDDISAGHRGALERSLARTTDLLGEFVAEHAVTTAP